MQKPILPPHTIGILGSGQLGRMLALAAKQMGYRVHVFSPDVDSPAGQVADREFSADYDDVEAVRAFAQSADVVTYEFENVPAVTAATCAKVVSLYPDASILRIAQHRALEKGALADAGLPVTPFRPIRSIADLRFAVDQLGCPAVLKTAQSGYDGKGQSVIHSLEEGIERWNEMGQVTAVLEAFIPFEREISVVAARGWDGTIVHYGVIENEHRHHILDLSSAPARVSPAVAESAIQIATQIMSVFDVVGVLCVECFVTEDERVLINEIAPRPHNSGHLTIEGCVTSQFEQQLRAVCGLPLGSAEYHAPTAMVNLLGDLWQHGEPHWEKALALPNVHLHLYGKREPRRGRKMGHLTVSAETVELARSTALYARSLLQRGTAHD